MNYNVNNKYTKKYRTRRERREQEAKTTALLLEYLQETYNKELAKTDKSDIDKE